ncbi:unnamed protein product [Hermetia illucens]|uniref:DUF4795 domain-containing protein n=2 Tax=Hermetia illucens TaxID=343691 RepID=A0A7R8UCV8_HERIL|nr:unnamed protein product [Hermetia illucens]
MESIDGEHAESAILTIEQLIDICLSPFHIDVNLLHALLRIIATKLNLQTVRIHLGSPGILAEINNILTKTRETFETYKIIEGGSKRPFKLSHCKLEKLEIPPDPPVEALYKLVRKAEDSKDFHRVTFFKDSPILQDVVSLTSRAQETGLTFAELLNLTKRLECCEIGIEKLTQLLQKLNVNYKELERSLHEISSLEHAAVKCLEDLDRRTNSSTQTDSSQQNKAHESGSKSAKDQEARKDLQRLSETTAGVIDQVNNMFGKMADFQIDMQKLHEENDLLKKAIQKSADSEKLDFCCKEICSLQKKMAINTDKIGDLVICSNKNLHKFKAVSDKLGELSKIRMLHQKVAELEEGSEKLYSEFETFTERYEQIKIIKADREELDYIFQCKADKEELQEFVTLELFNAIRHDLSNGIVQAFENIMETEVKWKKSEEQLRVKLNEKLDKSEKGPLAKMINDKVNFLQEKMNEVMGPRLDGKSAAVRTRALKDANCICCASEVDIICDNPLVPKLPPLRQTRKICPEPPDLRKRYCGGSHTIISPQKKIAQRRQAPMHVEADREPPELVEGINGMMYRVSKPECICGHKQHSKVL